MSVGSRLKEERLRLGLNQTDLAARAGASKSSQINWEKDVNSPPASALTAYAEAGVDVLYVLTGRRLPERAENPGGDGDIAGQLDAIERDLLQPEWRIHPDDDRTKVLEGTHTSSRNKLKTILGCDRDMMSPELIERATGLLDIATDPVKLSLFRDSDVARIKNRREKIKIDLLNWLDEIPYKPGGTIINILSTISLDYGVPPRVISDMIEYVYYDMRECAVK